MQDSGEVVGRVSDVYEGTGVYDTVRVSLTASGDDTDGGCVMPPPPPPLLPS